MRRPSPDYQFEAFRAIESIDDEVVLFNLVEDQPLGSINKVFLPTNEQERRSTVLDGYETVNLGLPNGGVSR